MVYPSFHPGRFILSHLDTNRQDSTIHDSLMNDKNSSEDQHYQVYSREKFIQIYPDDSMHKKTVLVINVTLTVLSKVCIL